MPLVEQAKGQGNQPIARGGGAKSLRDIVLLLPSGCG